jgi:hypothetical protein
MASGGPIGHCDINESALALREMGGVFAVMHRSRSEVEVTHRRLLTPRITVSGDEGEVRILPSDWESAREVLVRTGWLSESQASGA